jgi:hypothetical protein
MTTGGILCLGVVRNWSLLGCELTVCWFSGVGEEGNEMFRAAAEMRGAVCGLVGVFDIVFVDVMPVTSSSAVISSALGEVTGGPEEAVGVGLGLHALRLSALVPPCEQCTSAITGMF